MLRLEHIFVTFGTYIDYDGTCNKKQILLNLHYVDHVCDIYGLALFTFEPFIDAMV